MTFSYPLVSELPPLVDTLNWDWVSLGDFFVGTDEAGALWLTKMRGSFRAYREIVFERLVQRVGWLCQSSTFAILESDSLPRRTVQQSERFQVVTRLLSEHGHLDCRSYCPIGSLRGRSKDQSVDWLTLLMASPLEDSANIARAQILAPLLGGVEPAAHLITVDHEVFLIDGELMFSDAPSDVRRTSWWTRADGSAWPAGQRLTYDVCAAIGSFNDEDIENLLEAPAEASITLRWPIGPLLYEVRDYARAFASRRTISETTTD